MGDIVKLGFREAIGLPAPVHREQHLASRILSLLADRRVLYELYDREVPSRCLRSVEIIRQRLAEIRADARDFEQLVKRIDSMQTTCQRFMDEAGPLNIDEPLGYMQDRESVVRITAAMDAMRKAFGLHVSQLSSTSGIPVPSQLQMIVPQDDQPPTLS